MSESTIKAIHHIYPDEIECRTLDLTNNPPPMLEKYVEEQLTRIAGRDRFGDSILRVVWGQSELRFAYGEMRMKYLWKVIEGNEGYCFEGLVLERKRQRMDIGLPRWIIEEKVPPEQFLDRRGKEDVFGPFPEKGEYRHFATVQQFDKQANRWTYRSVDREYLTECEKSWHNTQQMRRLSGAKDEEYRRELVKEVKNIEDLKQQRWNARRAQINDMLAQELSGSTFRRMTHRHPNKGRGF